MPQEHIYRNVQGTERNGFQHGIMERNGFLGTERILGTDRNGCFGMVAFLGTEQHGFTGTPAPPAPPAAAPRNGTDLSDRIFPGTERNALSWNSYIFGTERNGFLF